MAKWFRRGPDRSDIQGHRAAYRTEEARDELAFHLKTTGLLRTIESDEQRAIHNWGVYLCHNLGLSEETIDLVIYAIVDAIMALPIPDREVDTGEER